MIHTVHSASWKSYVATWVLVLALACPAMGQHHMTLRGETASEVRLPVFREDATQLGEVILTARVHANDAGDGLIMRWTPNLMIEGAYIYAFHADLPANELMEREGIGFPVGFPQGSVFYSAFREDSPGNALYWERSTRQLVTASRESIIFSFLFNRPLRAEALLVNCSFQFYSGRRGMVFEALNPIEIELEIVPARKTPLAEPVPSIRPIARPVAETPAVLEETATPDVEQVRPVAVGEEQWVDEDPSVAEPKDEPTDVVQMEGTDLTDSEASVQHERFLTARDSLAALLWEADSMSVFFGEQLGRRFVLPKTKSTMETWLLNFGERIQVVRHEVEELEVQAALYLTEWGDGMGPFGHEYTGGELLLRADLDELKHFFSSTRRSVALVRVVNFWVLVPLSLIISALVFLLLVLAIQAAGFPLVLRWPGSWIGRPARNSAAARDKTENGMPANRIKV